MIKNKLFFLPLILCIFLPHQFQSLFFDGADMDERFIIAKVSRLGLANRLRTLADWYNIAIAHNRTLLVNWIPAADCNVMLSELFESGPKEKFKILPEDFSDSALLKQSLETLSSERNISFLDLDDGTLASKMSFFLSKEFLQSTDSYQILLTSYDGLLTEDDIPCVRYMTKHSAFLSSLVPNGFAREMVAEVKQRYFAQQVMIGVHYRSHDAGQDWAVVPPTETSTEATTFGTGATFEDFRDAMIQIQQFCGPRNCRFFIASNDESMKQRFLSTFLDAVSLSGGDYSRDSRDGMQFALVEWLLLSECDLLLNTYGSSFALEAAQVRGRPLVSIWHGHLIHHHSLSLPFCGHMQFAQRLSQSSKKHSYNEGTADHRTINGSMLMLKPCPNLQSWGLNEVYCCNQ